MVSHTQLDAITDFPGLLSYLEEELDWPIDAASFEEATFSYTAAELGLKDDAVGGPIEIKQLRPLVDGQPWGVFFLNLPQKKLSKTIVTNILGRLTVKTRAASNAPGRPAFLKSDLLFIASTGSDHDRRLTFAHFKDDLVGGNAATLELLGWDGDDTPRRLKLTESALATKLRWPDDTADADGWRTQWAGAFAHTDTHTTVRDVKATAIALAALARRIRARATELIAAQTADGSMVKLHAAFRAALIHDLTPKGFADTYAQTVAYGLLSTAISRSSGALTQDDLPANVAGTSPFLKEMLATFIEAGGQRGGHDGEGVNFDELGVAEIVELLRKADMEAVLADFDRNNPDEDPVIHFYERFLEQYDAEQKVKRGVFYTPRPIVGFIVRSVDEVLRNEFSLGDGLASTETWAEVIARVPEVKLPKGVGPNDPFVRILDPATGTGTFLVECVDLIHKTMVAKWRLANKRPAEIEALWNEYVPKHLLPRLTGFELMMAPYAIAHVKIGLKLGDTGYRFGSEARAQIYLTNALEPPEDFDMQLAFMSDALANEARAANDAKGQGFFTVVLGNPPYSIKSWNRISWIDDLCEAYKTTVRLEESQIQALSNDYIKFLRFAQFQIDRSGVGVVGFITGHGYTHGTQARDMRHSLMSTFTRADYVDLHGSVRRAKNSDEEDEPVFEIMTGVAIVVAARESNESPGQIRLRDLRGKLGHKFDLLKRSTARSLSKDDYFVPSASNFSFRGVGGGAIEAEYERFPSLTTWLGTGVRQADKEVRWATGFTSQQDDLAIGFSATDVAGKVADLARSASFEDLQASYRVCTTSQWNYARAKIFAKDVDLRLTSKVAYRPFDTRFTIMNRNLVTIPREAITENMRGGNIALLFSRAVTDERYAHVFVADLPSDKIFLSNKTSTNSYVAPLWLRGAGDGDAVANLARGVLDQLTVSTELAYSTYSAIGHKERSDLSSAFGPRDVFDWIYAVLHSPTYRSRYGDFLKSDFARVPLPKDRGVFSALVPLGAELVALHLLSVDVAALLADPKFVRLAGSGDNRVTRKAAEFEGEAWISGRMYISATQWFENIPERVANFYVGGYQPARKWLKDRTTKGGANPREGRILTPEEVLHYRRMIAAMDRTIDVMTEIDRVVNEHGGWPGAFQGMNS